jgi:hypothetical protein
MAYLPPVWLVPVARIRLKGAAVETTSDGFASRFEIKQKEIPSAASAAFFFSFPHTES